jgi:GT2 family glycosyltransferase
MARALQQQTWRDFRVIVVDDGSTDGTSSELAEILSDPIILRGDGRWWWAGCLEEAFRWLKAHQVTPETVIALMNDDVEISNDFLSNALDELHQHPHTLLLARQINAGKRSVTEHTGGGVHADLKQLRFTPAVSEDQINCLSTRGLFIRWGDCLQIGSFHPRILPHYLSDYEFTLRAFRLGYKLRVGENVALQVSLATTGVSRDELGRLQRIARLRMIFSPKYKENPLYWSGFVWLTVPWQYRPWLFANIWRRALFLIMRCLFS